MTSFLKDKNVQPTLIALTETCLKDYHDVKQIPFPGNHKLLT